MTVQVLRALAQTNQAGYLLALTAIDLDNGTRNPQTIAFILALITKQLGV